MELLPAPFNGLAQFDVCGDDSEEANLRVTVREGAAGGGVATQEAGELTPCTLRSPASPRPSRGAAQHSVSLAGRGRELCVSSRAAG